ncbi:MAG TPA: NADH-quinone oxidoreductase subunit NuoH [Gemmatimonadaceae bacterium]|nr:NADH-quinone oxidoreductase subunit NuoH [Gemmatimonadaceae bacterium]
MLAALASDSVVYKQFYDELVPVTGLPWLLFTILKLLVVFTVIMVGVAMLTLAERKISAWIQDRIGPNRTGYGGLLQPAADGLKNIMKEETYPDAAYTPLFILAPMLSFIPSLITFAVIPFAAPFSTRWGLVEMSVANLPIGFLYILAISSLGVYGIVLAGWSSNNKYSLLGGLRSSAQMVSYEISMGMAAVAVLLLSGNVSLPAIVQQQQTMGWNVFPLLIAFFIFCVASFAETNRLPFDMPEAESELIAGYHTEYSAMKFSMFFIAEYSNMVTASALMVTLFFGGWDIPGTQWDNLPPWTFLKFALTLGFFFAKLLFFLFLYMWIRWTLPRFRYDQLMSLGWKFMLPLALAYIVVTGGAILVLDMLQVPRSVQWFGISPFWAALGVLNIVLAVLVFVILDRGRIISPAYSRLSPIQIARLRAMSAGRSLAASQGD